MEILGKKVRIKKIWMGRIPCLRELYTPLKLPGKNFRLSLYKAMMIKGTLLLVRLLRRKSSWEGDENFGEVSQDLKNCNWDGEEYQILENFINP